MDTLLCGSRVGCVSSPACAFGAIVGVAIVFFHGVATPALGAARAPSPISLPDSAPPPHSASSTTRHGSSGAVGRYHSGLRVPRVEAIVEEHLLPGATARRATKTKPRAGADGGTFAASPVAPSTYHVADVVGFREARVSAEATRRRPPRRPSRSSSEASPSPGSSSSPGLVERLARAPRNAPPNAPPPPRRSARDFPVDDWRARDAPSRARARVRANSGACGVLGPVEVSPGGEVHDGLPSSPGTARGMRTEKPSAPGVTGGTGGVYTPA